MKAWLLPGSRRRRVLLGVMVYVICTAVYFGFAARDRITQHTPYNHFALVADSWLHGRLDLRSTPPPYGSAPLLAEDRAQGAARQLDALEDHLARSEDKRRAKPLSVRAAKAFALLLTRGDEQFLR